MKTIELSPGKWRLHPLDRRVLVDETESVIADLRNWRDTDDGAVLTQVPQMLELVLALSGSSGNWADPWLNDLAKKATEIEQSIQFIKKGYEITSRRL